MNNKKISFLILTDDTETPIRLVVTQKSLFLSGIGLVITLVLILAFIVDYSSLFVDSLEKDRVLTENTELKKQLNLVDSKLSALDLNLSRSQSFIAKLKLITNTDNPEQELMLSQANPDLINEDTSNISDLADIQERQNQNAQFFESRSQRDYLTLAVRIDKSIKNTEMQEQSMTELWQLLSDRQAQLSSTPSVKPAQGWISSLFGYRPNPFSGRTVLHAGMDIAANVGTPIIAPAAGVVVSAGYDEGYGRVIDIDHGFGLTTRYAHCSQVFVKIGQRVNRFDVIGSVGNTGRSTGAHLHYEVRVNGVPRNPLLYVLDD